MYLVSVCIPVQSCGCLQAAVELTASFLSAHGQGLGQAGQPTVHTHKTLQVKHSLHQRMCSYSWLAIACNIACSPKCLMKGGGGMDQQK